MKKVFLLMPVVVAILVAAACAPAAPKLTVPEGAIKLSEVVPGMGEHWGFPAELEAQAQAQSPLGPIYVAYKGEVVAFEYIWTEDMMQEESNDEVENALPPLPIGVTVDHVDIDFLPMGGEALEVPHWEIHLYFISQEEKAAITP